MFQELNIQLKAIANIDFVKELFDYIERERLGTIVAYNKTQLFERSIGADGVSLGTYKKSTEERYDSLKKAGTKYTMIDTGLFKSSIYAEVIDNEIFVKSTDPKLSDMLNSSIYNTTEFFGLTDDSSKHFINRWVKPYTRELLILKN